jgi:hypothetical protein
MRALAFLLVLILPAIAHAQATTCTMSASQVDRSVPLVVPGTDVPLGEVMGKAHVAVDLPPGAARARVRVSSAQVKLAVEAPLATLPVALVEDVAFGAHLTVHEGAWVRIDAARDGGLSISFDTDGRLEQPAGQTRLATDVGCDKVSLDTGDHLPELRVSPKDKPTRLLRGKRTPLSAKPGEPAGAFLVARGQPVWVITREKSWSMILYREAWMDVTGWLPTRALGGKRVLVLDEVGMEEGRDMPMPRGTPRTCQKEVPLVALVGGKPVPVGQVTAGGQLWTALRDGAYTAVQVDSAELRVAAGVRLAVATDVLDRACK